MLIRVNDRSITMRWVLNRNRGRGNRLGRFETVLAPQDNSLDVSIHYYIINNLSINKTVCPTAAVTGLEKYVPNHGDGTVYGVFIFSSSMIKIIGKFRSLVK